ncbi:MAG: DUF3313 family protein [Halioglobus sp.]
MNKLLIAACAFVFAAGASHGVMAKSAPPEVTPDGLVLEKRGAFQNTWIHPDADFSKYNQVMLVDGRVEYRDVGPVQNSRSSHLRSNERYFGISEKDRERFEQRVGESFNKQLVRSSRKFDIVEQAGPGTLILRGHLVDIASTVPPQLAGSGEVYSNSVGEVTLILELFDGETGKPLAMAIEKRAIQSSGGNSIDTMFASNSVSAWSEVNRWASRTGSRVAKGLDDMHKIKTS